MSHKYTLEIRSMIDCLNQTAMPRRTAERTIILIKRLDVEIERLYKTLGKVQCNQYTNGRNDGIKEFAEKLKERQSFVMETEYDAYVVEVKDVDNLVKEMTEDNDA